MHAFWGARGYERALVEYGESRGVPSLRGVGVGVVRGEEPRVLALDQLAQTIEKSNKPSAPAAE